MTARSPHSGHRRSQNRTPLIAAVAAAVLSLAIAAQAALATETEGAAARMRGLAVPRAAGEEQLTATRRVTDVFDGALTRFTAAGAPAGDGREKGRKEGREPLFELADGAVLKNVVLGSPASDGVRCLGSCTLENVYWEDVGGDAATFLGGSPDARYVVSGGGAARAADEVFRFDGAGTLTVRDFAVAGFGTLVRSCGDCAKRLPRHVVLDDVTATAPGGDLVALNAGLGDTARLSRVTVLGDSDRAIVPCRTFGGTGDGPAQKPDATADGVNCLFDRADIAFR
ncbi:pectate lyase [Streptomyces sp. NPDC021608]|uniref:pectate lyase n=1 Tax=Streptomyces sp. NPDC021608 TaxID=3154903 RepID=UPI0033FFD8B4